MLDPIKTEIAHAKMDEDVVLELRSTIKCIDSGLELKLNGVITEYVDIRKLPVGVHKLLVLDQLGCSVLQYIQVFELNEKGKKKINAQSEFTNLKGGKVFISDLIVEETQEKETPQIILGKNNP